MTPVVPDMSLAPDILRGEVQRLFAGPRSVTRGRVGVELELLPGDAEPAAALARAAAALPLPGRVTFEPGGQVEYGSTPCGSIADLVRETDAAIGAIDAAAAAVGMSLVARGLSPGRDPHATGLVNSAPRYRAMDRYFAARGPWGAWMMRLTASVQVNLDLGPPDVAARRWRAANGLAPVLVAAFANSAADLPDGTTTSAGRSWVWRRLDPTRTGVFGHPAAGAAPWTEYLAFALAAPVMFDHRMRALVEDPVAAPRFADWWAGRTDVPRPALADWRVHLTTLFPEIRPRGWLEIRSIDVPRRPWWSVPPAVLAAVMYDRRALAGVEELLAGRSEPTAELLDRAIAAGLDDPLLRQEATALFKLARGAMDRFPSGWFGAAERAVAAFDERYVVPGRTQADDARAIGDVARLAVPTDLTAAMAGDEIRAASPLPGSS